jgi:protein gp37
VQGEEAGMTRTSIEWATDSWNPIAAYDRETGKRGWFCTKVSPGCTNCYAEQWNRFRGNGHLYRAGNIDKVRFELAPTLTDPLHWRKPRRVFVNSMTDLFLEQHTDEMIVDVFAVMAISHYFGLPHEFLVLTKRPGRARDLLSSSLFWNLVAIRTLDILRDHGSAQLRVRAREAMCEDDHGDYVIVREPRVDTPLPNVWLGVSVENQQVVGRVPLLLQTPAAIRFLSCEPLLGPVEVSEYLPNPLWNSLESWKQPELDWIIVGGESGTDARPCNVAWVRYLVEQCDRGRIPVFVKQLGALPGFTLEDEERRGNAMPSYHHFDKKSGLYIKAMDDPKGGNPKEWPTELRVRQFPKVEALV